MKKVRLDVFIEPDCKACVAVMYSIREVQSRLPVEVNVYQRDVDGDMFRKRNVVITPAIFIEDVLTFYGEVTPEDITMKIHYILQE